MSFTNVRKCVCRTAVVFGLFCAAPAWAATINVRLEVSESSGVPDDGFVAPGTVVSVDVFASTDFAGGLCVHQYAISLSCPWAASPGIGSLGVSLAAIDETLLDYLLHPDNGGFCSALDDSTRTTDTSCPGANLTAEATFFGFPDPDVAGFLDTSEKYLGEFEITVPPSGAIGTFELTVIGSAVGDLTLPDLTVVQIATPTTITVECQNPDEVDVECDDGEQCSTGTCEADGTCTMVNATTVTACDPITAPEDLQCLANFCNGTGQCGLPTPGATCDDTDDNECTFAECDAVGFCEQSNSVLAGTSCTDTDGIECTFAECDGAGTCTQDNFEDAGTGCTDIDGIECTFAECDGAGACTQDNPVMNGTSCDDGEQCTGPDTCLGGLCQGPQAPNGTLCDDNDACTENDDCFDGVCEGTPLECEFGCVPGSGCFVPFIVVRLLEVGTGSAKINAVPGDIIELHVITESIFPLVRAYQLDFGGDSLNGCSYDPLPGGTGVLANCDTCSIDCGTDPPTAVGSRGVCRTRDDYLLLGREPNVIIADNPNLCQVVAASFTGSSVILGTKYLASLALEVSIDASGQFEVGLEGQTSPCNPNNGTRILVDVGECVTIVVVPAVVNIIQSCSNNADCDDSDDCTQNVCSGGTCTFPNAADGTVCGSPDDTECDNPDSCLAGICTANNEPDGTDCADNAFFCDGDENCQGGVCTSPGDPCDLTQFCREDLGICAPCEVDADCPGGLFCREFPDFGLVACVFCRDDADCPADNACTTTCDQFGDCQLPVNEPNGTPCGSPDDTECDNPDTCLSGLCRANNEPDDTPCTDDFLFCTGDEECQGGVCTSSGNPCVPPEDCDEVSGTCGGGPCTTANDCPDGQGCVDGACGLCVTDGQCDDQNACTHDACDVGGLCTHELPAGGYGDIDNGGDVNLDDLFCMFDGFGGDFSMCSFANINISPCGKHADPDISLDDLFALFEAFGGGDPCTCGP